MDNEQLTRNIKKYGDTVYRVAYNYARNPVDSEDIVQETFLRLYRCGKTFESEEHIKAWLIRVAANQAKNHIRSAHINCCTELDENLHAPQSNDYDIDAAMDSLSEKYGIVIYLYYFEGYGTREIASLLRLTESNVKARLKRGREKLKAFFTEE